MSGDAIAFFKELKELCLKHDVLAVGYQRYNTGRALCFEFDEGSYLISGIRENDKFRLWIDLNKPEEV